MERANDDSLSPPLDQPVNSTVVVVMLTPLNQESWSQQHADHLLHRAGFGSSPEERKAFYELGRDQGIAAAVDSLIEDIEDWSGLPVPFWSTEADPNGDLWDGSSERLDSFVRWYYNCLMEAKPLAAKLFKFLVDHFAVDFSTCPTESRFMYFVRFFDLLRKHAGGANGYGSFRVLANEVSWSGAMIRTLDLHESSANNINENFGRELLELFTLGVDGGYTEDDVGAAAEAFTGRRLYRHQSPDPDARQIDPQWLAPEGTPPGGSYQDVDDQDLLPKSFLGHDRMPDGRSIATGDDIMELIFDNVQCAKHLCWKFWRYFASTDPDESILQQLALSFRNDCDYSIRPLLREIFLSEAFYGAEAVGTQIKDAGDYIVCLCKQLGVELPPDATIYSLSESLGYNPVYPPNIAGWPEPDAQGNEWMAAGLLLLRLNMPGIWIQNNYDVMNDWSAERAMEEAGSSVDWDELAPPEMRTQENFPLLLEDIEKRFLPLSPFRASQKRLLYDRFRKMSENLDTLEAYKETIRLALSLPEYQMQ